MCPGVVAVLGIDTLATAAAGDADADADVLPACALAPLAPVLPLAARRSSAAGAEPTGGSPGVHGGGPAAANAADDGGWSECGDGGGDDDGGGDGGDEGFAEGGGSGDAEDAERRMQARTDWEGAGWKWRE
jgi:hypothetical protein